MRDTKRRCLKVMCQIKHCSHLSKLDSNSEASCRDPSPLCTPVSSGTGISCSRHTEADKTRNQVTKTHIHIHLICPKLSRSESLWCLPHKSPTGQPALQPALLWPHLVTGKQHLKDAKDGLGCTPQTCQHCTGPAKSEERAWGQQQRPPWFNGWGDLTY